MFLLLASLCFYAWGEPFFVFVMLVSIVVNWLFGLLVVPDAKNPTVSRAVLRRFFIFLMLVFNLSIFFVFKYLMFTLANINYAFGVHLFVPHILLPIGISFYTFQAISYVIDVYRGDAEVQRNPLKVGLYMALFPALIAGPIIRYKSIAEQIDNRTETLNDFSHGCCRFIAGFTKKMLLANTFALLADRAFSMPSGEFSIMFAWMGAVAYTLQIYYDFSGYSCMAIGLGKMFGFSLLENFNYPYISRSVSDFWRRWHISLSSWFRDYVFFPLGGSRVKTRSRLVFNLFVVWGLTGVWHGANWTFICWGLFYFMLLTIEKLSGFDDRVKKESSAVLRWDGGAIYGFLYRFGRHVYVIWAFMTGWVLFRSETLNDALSYLQAMYGVGNIPLYNATAVTFFNENFYFWIAGILFALPVIPYFQTCFGKSRIYGVLYPVTYFFLFAVTVAYMVKGTYNPFIYFNF
ncbi:alginate O-acetylation protein [Planctomycetales bacterium]|nr:alginate O-acetylation protein [Planctomycetales bacterium]